MRVALLFFFLLLSMKAMSQDFPATGFNDTTDGIMKKHLKEGIELLEVKSVDGIELKLYLSKSAKKAIAKKAFLVKDSDFSQEKLNAFILKAFESSLTYFRSVSPGGEVKELNLIIIDEGGDKGTISEVHVNSRVIDLHLVRWHKYSLKNSEHYGAVSSIHEFAHVLNYMYSPNETKFHREMAAVLVECLNFVQLYGMDIFIKGYSWYYTSDLKDSTLILEQDYSNMLVLRNLAFYLITSIYNGTYKGASEPRDVTEKFIIDYLKNPMNDVQGFNSSLKNFGVVDSSGNDLTLSTLQKDTQSYLCQTKNLCQ